MALQDPSRARPKRGICGIERLLLEHLRQRNLGVLLRSLADSPIPDQRVSREVAERLLEEHARHVEDDEEAFFPLIAAHLPESDPLHCMLEDLRQDHALIGKLVCDAVSALEASLHPEGPGLDTTARLAARLLVARQNRHLAIENAIVLPRAQEILGAQGCEALAHRLAARSRAEPCG